MEAGRGPANDFLKETIRTSTPRRSSHLTVATIFPTDVTLDAMNGFPIRLVKKSVGEIICHAKDRMSLGNSR